MKTKPIILSLLMVGFTAGQVFAGDASITGTIRFGEENVPVMKVINMNADPKCVQNNQGKEVRAQTLVLGPDKTMANIFVRVKSGLPEGKTYDTPTDPIVIDQIGCMYVPHVLASMVNQPVKILNSDGTLHNVHALPKVNQEFNIAMPAFKKEITKTLDKVEPDPFKIKCDVHPWMGGYMAVMSHPYFDVTKEDGKYTIKGLEPGTYEIEIWHEKLGTQTAKVTVAAGETKTQDFVMKKPTSVGKLEAIIIVR